MSGASSFLAALEGNTFPSASSPGGTTNFQNVEEQFQQAGVPDPIWEAILLSEDASLNPAQVTPESDGSTSYGWFQFNSNGLGAGYPISTLEDPQAESQLAASKMGTAIAAYQRQTGDTSLMGALGAVINAGWPGQGDTSADIAKRRANLQAILAASGSSPATTPSSAGSGAAGNAGSPNGPTTAGSQPFGNFFGSSGPGSLPYALGQFNSPGQVLTNTEKFIASLFVQGAVVVLGVVLLIAGIQWLAAASGVETDTENAIKTIAPVAEAA